MPNTATTFKQSREENYRDIFLNVDHFADRFDYVPYGGVRRTVIGWLGNGPIADREKLDSFEEFEELTVSCCRDPEAANSNGDRLGGIDRPNVGDLIILDGDPDSQAFVYVSTLKQTNYSYLLKYQRSKTRQLGTAQTRR